MQYILILITALVIRSSTTNATPNPITSAYHKDVTLTEVQKAKLEGFKLLVSDSLPHDYMKEDIYLLKTLRVTNFNISSAKDYLNEVLKWRELNKVDDLFKENFDDFKRASKLTYSRDKFGQPVLILAIGSQEARRIVRDEKEERIIRSWIQLSEEFCAKVREDGKEFGNVTRGNAIIDISGWSISDIRCFKCLPLLRNVVKNLIPAQICVDKVILVNGSFLAAALLERGRSLFLTSDMLDKVVNLRGNKESNLEFFKSFVPIEKIPSLLGGKKQI